MPPPLPYLPRPSSLQSLPPSPPMPPPLCISSAYPLLDHTRTLTPTPSANLLLSPLLHRRRQTKALPFLSSPATPPLRLLPPVSALSNEACSPIVHFEELVEKDWSFLEPDPATSEQEQAQKAGRVISAAGIGEKSRVLVSFGTDGFIDRLVESCPCELLLVIHDSLFALAMIKEKYDKVRCWQGPIMEVPGKFSPFDVVLVCYFPGMGVSVDQLFGALAGRCSPGARVVISIDQGRDVVEHVHRNKYPDMVTSDLPDRLTLEKAAASHSFQLTEFVDDPTFYLAVLKFS